MSGEDPSARVPPKRTGVMATEEFDLGDVWTQLAHGRPHRAVLAVSRGPDLGNYFEVGVDPLVIGRDADCAVVLQGQGISRRHLEIRQRAGGDGHEACDLGSRNGTFLNQSRVPAEISQSLRDGDQIVLGDTVLEYVVENPNQATFRDELGRLANIDDLTGLLVKRRFDAAFAGALRSATVVRSCVGVAMIDMDGLKTINDTHGHLFGAHSISEVGRIVGKEIGSRGVASRFGGDEFCLFLRGTDKPASVQFAEHLRRLVEAHVFELNSIQIQPTLSAGVAAFPEDGEDPEQLLGAADAALYRAKRAGRNRVST